MIHGTYSDGQSVTLADGRKGIITRSLGHFAVQKDRTPDESRGPRYEVLLDGRTLTRDGREELHGEGYLIVEETSEGTLTER